MNAEKDIRHMLELISSDVCKRYYLTGIRYCAVLHGLDDTVSACDKLAMEVEDNMKVQAE